MIARLAKNRSRGWLPCVIVAYVSTVRDGGRECLRQIYSHIYVEYVVKNPIQPRMQPITASLFILHLNKYIRGLPYFSSS